MSGEKVPSMVGMPEDQRWALSELLHKQLYCHTGYDVTGWMPQREITDEDVRKFDREAVSTFTLLAASSPALIPIALLSEAYRRVRRTIGGLAYVRRSMERDEPYRRELQGMRMARKPTQHLLDWLIFDKESSGWSEDGKARTLSVADWLNGTNDWCLQFYADPEKVDRLRRFGELDVSQLGEVLPVVANAITTWPVLTQQPVFRHLGQYIKLSSVPGESITVVLADTPEGLG